MPTRPLAFLDVLGFSDMVRSNPLETLLKKYEALIIQSQLAAAGNNFRIIGQGDDARAVADLDKAPVDLLLISDSIVISGRGDSATDVLSVIAVARALLLGGFYVGLPLRGGVAIGELGSVDRAVGHGFSVRALLGSALVAAHDLEKTQQWSGAVVDAAVVEGYDAATRNSDDVVRLDSLTRLGVLVEADVPHKTHTARQWTLGWPWARKDKPEERQVRRAFEMHGKSVDGVAEKVENTVSYLHGVRPD